MTGWLLGWAVTVAEFARSALFWAAAVSVVLCLVAGVRPTRPVVGLAYVIGSYVVWFVAWWYGAALAFLAWRWTGLVVGVVLLGFGVVPIGAAGAALKLGAWTDVGALIGMVLLAAVLRLTGAWLIETRPPTTPPSRSRRIASKQDSRSPWSPSSRYC